MNATKNSEITISLNQLTKMYGSTRGIEDVSFDVYSGEVLGFLGPNGAGKTTAIRTLLGLIKATSGEAKILGKNALKRDIELRRSIGYLPGIAATYDAYTARDYLRLIAKLRRLNLNNRIEELAKRIDLDLSIHIHDLSKGNRQKVSLIQAFMHNPKVLFLDEPTSGLDPLVQREFEKMLDEVRSQGASVILSSHVLSEVEHLANRIAIINKGRIVVVDEIQELKRRARRKIDFYFDTPVSSRSFQGLPNVSEMEFGDKWMRCVVAGSEYELLKRAVELKVSEVRTRESSLEEIFLDLIGAA